MKHEAKKEEKSFPQNKYILTQIKRKPPKQPTTIGFQKCEEHRKELSLYCKEPDCGKPICRLCLGKHHKKHDIIAIEEQGKEVLMRDLMRIDMNLGTKVEMILQAKKNIGERTKSTIEEIKRKKEEFDRHFQKMIKEAEGQSRLQSMLIDDEISAMYSNIQLLRSLRQNIQNEEEISHEEIISSREAIRGIIENINANLSGERSFEYPVVSLFGCFVEEFLGDVTQEEITIPMPDLHTEMKEQVIPKNITNAAELNCTSKLLHVTTPPNQSENVPILFIFLVKKRNKRIIKYFSRNGYDSQKRSLDEKLCTYLNP